MAALLPRLYLSRRVLAVCAVLLTLFILLHTSSPHSPSLSFLPSFGFTSRRPVEYDENGICLFLSPFDALSREEQALAQEPDAELEQVSPGIFKAKNSTVHPFLGFVRDAERRWNTMMDGQSKTLVQAYDKYVAKWGRPPPKGFDSWYIFAKQHDVLLIDEFDAIMDSLMVYYGLPIPTLQQRLKEVEKIEETFTLIVHDGRVELQWNDNFSRDKWWASTPRADAQINLLEPFINLLPSFRATFSVHDQPSIMLNWHRWHALDSAARQHKVSNDPNEQDLFKLDWHGACAPTAPLNKGVKEELASDTFIVDHVDTMNPCNHPSLMENHGMMLEEHGPDSKPQPHTKLYPIFVQSKMVLNGDIPITPVGKDGLRDDVGVDPEWDHKSEKVYWRGLATGMNHNKKAGSKWRQSHRERLHTVANPKDAEAETSVLLPVGSSGMATYQNHTLQELSKRYMDVKMSGGKWHWQCDKKDGTCQEMLDEYDFAPQDKPQRSNDFKYVIDTDGNAWSSRFPRLMYSLNVVLKATVFPEWNSHHLPAWFAYVPLKMDYSDLYSIIAWFRGTPSGKGGHDEVARRIALNGQCWVERTWRREDLQIYMFRLYLEYGRLVSPNRDNGQMDFVLQDFHRHERNEP